jgi:hypothetical protein
LHGPHSIGSSDSQFSQDIRDCTLALPYVRKRFGKPIGSVKSRSRGETSKREHQSRVVAEEDTDLIEFVVCGRTVYRSTTIREYHGVPIISECDEQSHSLTGAAPNRLQKLDI